MNAQPLTAARVVELMIGEYSEYVSKLSDQGLESEFEEGGCYVWSYDWGAEPSRLDMINCCVQALQDRMEGQTDEEIIEYFAAYGPKAVARWNKQKPAQGTPAQFIPVFVSDSIPDTTYFRVADVQPEFADLNGTINPSLDDRKAVKVWSGIGTYRSFLPLPW